MEATSVREPAGAGAAVRGPAAVPEKLKVVPVKYWAFAGALITAFMAYVMIRWVAGPYFERVDTGPTPLPEWMKISMIAWQVIMPAIWLFLVYRFIVRPWRRERRITVDGAILIAGTTVVFQDGMSNYFNHWITYNSYLVNWGSWYNDVPGWMAFGEPGRMLVEPPLFIPFAHGCAWLAFAAIGSKAIRATRARWPGIGVPGLLVMTYCLTFVLDIILEGLIWMPFGVFTYAGGHVPLLFGDAYHKFPLNEALFIGTWSTAVVFLYHFRNDKGETWVERGASQIKGGPLKQGVLRILAMIAALQIGLLVFYTVPQTAFFASKSTEWPQDLQQRSYLTDGLCGEGTDWACPGPVVPLNRGNAESQTGARLGPRGELTYPPGSELPAEVPFSTEAEGPFDGGVLP